MAFTAFTLVYTVPMAGKHLQVREARARFGEILDAAESGIPVYIERRGVRFRVVAERVTRTAATPRTAFEFIDDDVLAGQWTWHAGRRGLAVRRRKP